MTDFSALLKRPAGESKKPPALPVGDFPGIIKSHELGDNNKNKTPYVRFFVGLTGWPDEVDADDREQDGKPIDLSKKQFRKDFYLSDDALWRLDEFIKAMGVDATGRDYEEVLPELTGLQCTVEVQQYMNQNTSEIGNQVGNLKPLE